MIADNVVEAINRQLFASEKLRAYAILDGAAIPDLLDRLYGDYPEFAPIMPGELEPDMAEVTPYLARLEQGTEFANWVVKRGWGRHWGVFALSRGELQVVQMQCRRLLFVHDAGGTPLLFRFYDPRVLRTYLPTCGPEEWQTFFGPVDSFIAEAETPGTLTRYRLEGGLLSRQEVALK